MATCVSRPHARRDGLVRQLKELLPGEGATSFTPQPLSTSMRALESSLDQLSAGVASVLRSRAAFDRVGLILACIDSFQCFHLIACSWWWWRWWQELQAGGELLQRERRLFCDAVLDPQRLEIDFADLQARVEALCT